MKRLGQEFKEFIMHGNVVMLAVAVIIGSAFTDIVNAFSEFIIMPLIAAIGGQPDFSSIGFEINGAHFGIGSFLNAVIAFLIVAAIVFFAIVKPMNALLNRSKKVEDPTTKECPFCKSEIALAATRCPNCTSELAGVTA